MLFKPGFTHQATRELMIVPALVVSIQKKQTYVKICGLTAFMGTFLPLLGNTFCDVPELSHWHAFLSWELLLPCPAFPPYSLHCLCAKNKYSSFYFRKKHLYIKSEGKQRIIYLTLASFGMITAASASKNVIVYQSGLLMNLFKWLLLTLMKMYK